MKENRLPDLIDLILFYTAKEHYLYFLTIDEKLVRTLVEVSEDTSLILHKYCDAQYIELRLVKSW